MLSSVKIKALFEPKAFKRLYGKTEARTEERHISLLLKALLVALVHNVHLPPASPQRVSSANTLPGIQDLYGERRVAGRV